jgi:hypothetical protein
MKLDLLPLRQWTKMDHQLDQIQYSRDSNTLGKPLKEISKGNYD